jgi:tetratricopeptide (TPR) repeat protein
MKRFIVPAMIVVALAWSGCTPPNKNFTGGKLDYKAQRYEKAKDQFSVALTADPQNPDIHFYMGRTLLALKDYDGARAEFDQTLELGGDAYKSKIKAVVDRPYVDLYNDGKTYADSGRSEKGIAAMQKAALLDPARPDAHLALGALYANAEEYDKAAASLDKAVALDPDNRDAYFNLGIVHYKAANYDKAIAAFQKVLELTPGELAALENLARCYQLAERYDEMVPIYGQIIEADPESADAHYNYGVALVNAGRMDAAVVEFEAVHRLKPDDSEALIALCRLYRDNKRWDDALAGLEQYIAANPDDPAGYTEKARVYTAMADERALAGDDAGANQLRREALDALTIAGNKSGGS